jgi:hypothetical protein
MMDRILAPPTPPALVRPRSANRPEHTPAENPGPDVPKASSGEILIDAHATAIPTEQLLLKRSRGDDPTMKRGAAYAAWVVDVLVWLSAGSIE